MALSPLERLAVRGIQPGEVIKFRAIRWEGLSRAPVLARGFSKYIVGLAIKRLLQLAGKIALGSGKFSRRWSAG